MNDIVRALAGVVDALDTLGRSYRVGGSVASSALGVPRSTIDVGIVCELRDEDVPPFVTALSAAYYVDADRIALSRVVRKPLDESSRAHDLATARREAYAPTQT